MKFFNTRLLANAAFILLILAVFQSKSSHPGQTGYGQQCDPKNSNTDCMSNNQAPYCENTTMRDGPNCGCGTISDTTIFSCTGNWQCSSHTCVCPATFTKSSDGQHCCALCGNNETCQVDSNGNDTCLCGTTNRPCSGFGMTCNSDGNCYCGTTKCNPDNGQFCRDGNCLCGNTAVCGAPDKNNNIVGDTCYNGDCYCGELTQKCAVGLPPFQGNRCVNGQCQCGDPNATDPKKVGLGKPCQAGEMCGTDGQCHCGSFTGPKCTSGEICKTDSSGNTSCQCSGTPGADGSCCVPVCQTPKKCAGGECVCYGTLSPTDQSCCVPACNGANENCVNGVCIGTASQSAPTPSASTSAPSGNGCEKNSDCPYSSLGQYCDGTNCRCNSNANCPTGQICNTDSSKGNLNTCITAPAAMPSSASSTPTATTSVKVAPKK